MSATPTVAELSMFRDGAIDPAARTRIDQHTRACDQCGRVLAAWSGADAALLATRRGLGLWRRNALATVLGVALVVAGSGAAVGVVTMILPARGIASTQTDLPGARAATGLPLPATASLGDWSLREVHVTRGPSISSADLRYAHSDGRRVTVIVWGGGVSATPGGVATSDVVGGVDVTRYEGGGLVTVSFEHRGSLVQITSAAEVTRTELAGLIGSWIGSAD